jgi:hypothetical protein
MEWIVALLIVALIFCWLVALTVLYWRSGSAQLQIEIVKLRKANHELEARVRWLLGELTQAKAQIVALAAGQQPSGLRRHLLVGIASGQGFTLDLTVFRKVWEGDGLHWQRLMPLTSEGLKTRLDRRRRSGNAYKYLHLACHGGKHGLQFDDGLVTGEWLSEHLKGVQVLLIAACEADMVADWVGVVPYVVSMTEKVEHPDAAAFAETFWSAISKGLDPEAAFYQALDLCPPNVAEFAELHL